MNQSKYPDCPNCKSSNVIPIIYGMPGSDDFKRHDDGEIILGGCVISENHPYHHCKDCKHKW